MLRFLFFIGTNGPPGLGPRSLKGFLRARTWERSIPRAPAVKVPWHFFIRAV